VQLERARELAASALASVEASRRRLDDLNVYPVPDGDTGTNLTLTVRSVVEALDRSAASSPPALAKELSRAALMGARGNSGVILSQIVRGFAEVLAEHEQVDGGVLAQAFRAASDAAYRAVRRPVEGTMLSVIRELAEESERSEVRSLEPVALLRRLVERGERAVARTPELLPLLREAGVVDAGGAGLLEVLRGLAAGAAGESLPAPPPAGERLGLEAIHQERSRYRYCTVFVVTGEGLDEAGLEEELEQLGDSLLVVGDPSALKVHLHTDDPGAALSLGTRIGAIEGIEIANMHLQAVEREERLAGPAGPAPTTGLVAVAPGAGNRRLFESYGASRVIEGGQTMNPSTAEILAAVESAPAAEVIVLPNNANVIASAEQAAGLASKPVRVVPSRSVQAGLAAVVRYLPSSSAEENERAMLEALEAVAAGEVTVASRDAEIDGVRVRKGNWLGLADGAAIASGEDFEPVAAAVIDRLLEGGREVLTVLTGAGAPELAGLLSGLGERHPGVEVEVHDGEQPHYALLLAAE
jgi:DAK2 domain fusion protein YloV